MKLERIFSFYHGIKVCRGKKECKIYLFILLWGWQSTVAQEGCGVSFFGYIQNSPEYDPVQCALVDPDWAGGWD